MNSIEELCLRTENYLPGEQIDQVRRAYTFGAEAHDGQLRKSGEPYIEHPIAVATILADMHMDAETLVAAILHDVIEDTHTGKDTISQEFGAEVAEIVDGLSKMTQIEFASREEAQAQNFQKMLMAMASDIRVILVKLADRLHNMRTLDALNPEKRRRIARETLEIYAPIAQRLGMNMVRLELEELGFRALHPMRHRVLKDRVKRARGNRKELVSQITNSIRRRLRQERIVAQVLGREKHLYGIYRKMRGKRLPFGEVFDVFAFRIIVDKVDTAYRVLGSIHSLYKPLPGQFKDYIAIPKANGYQSLHTVLFGPQGSPIEVQIRTRDMDEVAETGIAAHWLYKSESTAQNAHRRATEWLRGLLEIQRQAGNSQEFLEHVKIDLFPQEVFVFTPKGDIISLPSGATPIDLAYAIHSDLGNSCVAARIDRRLAPLRTKIRTGQTVEVITAPGGRPNPSWLSFVVTGKARSTIRAFLKNLRRDEAITLGRRMLNRELQAAGADLEQIDVTRIEEFLRSTGAETLDDLLEAIGLGNRLAPLVAPRLTGKESDLTPPPHADGSTPLLIRGTEGTVVSFPKCCHPIPGDPILGHLSSGKGLVIHHQDCPNVTANENASDKWVEVEWAKDIAGEFSAEVRLEAVNQRGALATVATVIADEQANIEDLDIVDRDDRVVEIRFMVTVRDRPHLATVIRRLRTLRQVIRVIRNKA